MPMIRKMEPIDFSKETPTKPVPTTMGVGASAVITPPSDIDIDQYKMDYQVYKKSQDNLNDSMYTLYSLVWGQFTSSLQEELRGIKNFTDKDFDFKIKLLLENIQQVSAGIYKQTVNINESVFNAARKLHTFKQYENESCESYLTRYTALLDILNMAEVNILDHLVLKKYVVKEIEKADPD